jgi:hypothetical protein
VPGGAPGRPALSASTTPAQSDRPTVAHLGDEGQFAEAALDENRIGKAFWRKLWLMIPTGQA